MKYQIGAVYVLSLTDDVKRTVYIEEVDSEYVYLNGVEFTSDSSESTTYRSPEYILELPVKRGRLQRVKACDLRD